MSKEWYKITAQCDSRKCKGRTFTVKRNKVVKKSTGGWEYTIENVVCPECRMWADITKIEKV